MSGDPIHGTAHGAADDEVPFGRVLVLFGWLAGGTIFACLVVLVLLRAFEARDAKVRETRRPSAQAAEHLERLPPEPRLQTHPREDLAALRRQEDEVLRSYRWVDERAGVVRIPIEEAMRLIVERGLPARRAGSGDK